MANILKSSIKPWNIKGQSKPWNPIDTSGKPFGNATRKNAWFYQSLSWKKARNNYIGIHPMCEEHEHKGLLTITGYYVDHINPLGILPRTCEAIRQACDPINLQTLCKTCHHAKTNKEISNNKKR